MCIRDSRAAEVQRPRPKRAIATSTVPASVQTLVLTAASRPYRPLSQHVELELDPVLAIGAQLWKMSRSARVERRLVFALDRYLCHHDRIFAQRSAVQQSQRTHALASLNMSQQPKIDTATMRRQLEELVRI